MGIVGIKGNTDGMDVGFLHAAHTHDTMGFLPARHVLYTTFSFAKLGSIAYFLRCLSRCPFAIG
jgi:hypothetical protein